MSIQVVTVTSRIPGPSEPYYKYGLFIESLKRFGIEPTVLGMGEPWWGLITKPKRMRDWLRVGECKADLCLWTDSFDVVFLAHPEKIAASYLNLWAGKPVLYNAERGIWPRSDLADRFPDNGSPWRYLNCGLILAPPAEILKVLEWMPLDDTIGDCPDPMHNRRCEPNDQAWHQLAWSARPTAMLVDGRCELFQSLSACEASEFEADTDGLLNKVTGTRPLVAHFNGGSKDQLLPGMMRTWGLG